jgi:hypothetical protein
MSLKMSLNQYFKKPIEVDTIMVQARIPVALAKSLKYFMKERRLNWTKLILGSLTALNDEVKKK